MAEAKICDICKSENDVMYHDENYYEVWKSNPLCKKCHTILHDRFNSWQSWLDLLAKNYNKDNSNKWFHHLKAEPIDLAAKIREHNNITSILDAITNCHLVAKEHKIVIR
jgi:hypothetical protein